MPKRSQTPKPDDESTGTPISSRPWTFAELRSLAGFGVTILVFMSTPALMRYYGAPWIETIFLLPAVWCVMAVVAYLGLELFSQLFGQRSGSSGDSKQGKSIFLLGTLAVFLASILFYLLAKLTQYLFF